MSIADELNDTLRTASDPEIRRDTALALLQQSKRRQYVDGALRALNSEAVLLFITDKHRDELRQVALHYFDAPPEKDKGGMIREQVLKILVNIGHPDDIDLYKRGVVIYHRQPVNDSAQNLRATALAGLATCDRTLAGIHATRLLGEEDTSQLNCEPAITAIQVLKTLGNILPVYQFIQFKGMEFERNARGEAVAEAFDALGEDFPPDLFIELATPFIDADATVSCTGIVNVLTRADNAQYLALLRDIISRTESEDLHHYALIMMGVSRQASVVNQLYELAYSAPLLMRDSYIEAIELTPESPKRAEMIAHFGR